MALWCKEGTHYYPCILKETVVIHDRPRTSTANEIASSGGDPDRAAIFIYRIFRSSLQIFVLEYGLYGALVKHLRNAVRQHNWVRFPSLQRETTNAVLIVIEFEISLTSPQ